MFLLVLWCKDGCPVIEFRLLSIADEALLSILFCFSIPVKKNALETKKLPPTRLTRDKLSS
jgi:hypothetical protein